MPTISIVMATFNGSKYISSQLDSILKQTYKDFEIIIVDDCSRDHTVGIIKNFFKKNSFYQYELIVNDYNIGPTRSFQKGILNSRGKYIAISDQDDIWFSKKLAISLKVMKDCNADIVHSPSLVLKHNQKISSVYPKYRKFKTLFGRLLHNNARGATFLMRRKFVDCILPFSDYDLYDKWIYFLGILYSRVIYIAKPLHYYRIHRNNYIGVNFGFSSKEDVLKKLNSRMLFYSQLLNFAQRNKNVNSIFVHNDVLEEIKKIIRFINETSMCLKSTNAINCMFRYIDNVFTKEFNNTEKIIYFYYYLLKMK